MCESFSFVHDLLTYKPTSRQLLNVRETMILQQSFAKVSTQNDVPDSSGSLSALTKINEADDAVSASTT